MWAKLGLTALVVALATIGYWRSSLQHADILGENQAGSDGSESLRKPMPEIIYSNEQGKVFKLADLKGKVVLLSFWASWCTPCIVELPSFIELHEKFHKEGLEILALNVDDLSDETKQSIRDFWKAKSFPFETYFDPQKAAADRMRVENLPTNLLIDRKGRLVAQGTGASDWTSDQVQDSIRQLLAE